MSLLPPKNRVCYAAESRPAEILGRNFTTQTGFDQPSAVVPSSYPGAELSELGKRSDASPGGGNIIFCIAIVIFIHV